MDLQVLAVYDNKLEAYMRPFYVPTLGAGIRSFQDEVNRKDSEMNKHPEDYQLRHLGTLNESQGRFINAPEIKTIGYADQMIKE